MERVLLHGNNKSHAELKMALEHGVGRVVVDNLPELRQLAALAKAGGQDAGDSHSRDARH